MKYLITESQLKKLHNPIQRAIDIALKNIKEESEDWGMDAISEINQVQSVDKIKVSNIDISERLEVYVDIYINNTTHYFDDLINEIEARISEHFPNVEVIENEVIDERKFGPGIDW
jgi:divalent metal cation (Fe/Co/Zn/Cd) transporter